MTDGTKGSATVSGGDVEPGPARRPDRGTVLEGRHVRLVPVDPDAHAASLYAASHGSDREDLWRYLGSAPFPDEAAFRAYLETAAVSADPFMFTLLDRASGRPVGHATYMRIEPDHRVIEVGNILYTPALQRSPAGTEAMYLMARHAFEVLGYRRYEWKCNALNAPSRRAAARYGFVPEGLFRQHMIVKGLSRDTAWFSMLDREWPARKRAFELWLSEANFDPDGRQKLSLGALNATAIPGFGFRRAGPDDAAAFAHLQGRAYAWNREQLGLEPIPLLISAERSLALYEVWLMEDDAGLAGALALAPHPDHLEVWSVSVDPDRQDAGVGRALLAAAEARAAALGLRTLRLVTGAPLVKNIDWYGRRGYALDRTEDLGDRRIVHMTKTIG